MTVKQVEFTFDSDGLAEGASTLEGTLTIESADITKQSFVGKISPSRNYNSPPADDIIGNFTNGKSEITKSLQTDKTYYLRLRTYPLPDGDGQASVYKYFSFKVPKITKEMIAQKNSSEENGEPSEQTSVALNDEIKIAKSLLAISTDTRSKDTLSCAIRKTGIDVAAPVSNTAPAYYAFGTTLFFAPKASTSNQSGGLGFFANNSSTTGYFISVKTSEAAATLGDEFKILKVKGGVVQPLPDNQVLKTTQSVGYQVGIIPGTSYKIDVKVKVFSNKTIIIAYINGFRVIAEDTGSTANPTLSRSDYISLFANLGTIYFDYAYAMAISEQEYNNLSEDLYNQQFTGLAKLAYGDLFVSGLTAEDSNSSQRFIEEFGPIAREIRYIKKRYERSPSYPKFTFQNLNKGVDVLASKLSSFDAELYLINSSGVSSSVSSASGTQISVVGNNLVKSDQIVYSDEDSDKFGIQEPITFESYWVQKISDAKNLSDFIKFQWSKSQRTISIKTFGNPLISVADIIAINYPYHGLQGTEKFIVTDVEQAWGEGLETTITARSIYSQ